MKIRNGFVSNSSSSSFILIGIQIPDTELSDSLREDMWEDATVDLLQEDYNGRNLLGDMSDLDEGDSGEVSYQDFESILPAIQKYFPEITVNDIKVFYGTRSC